MAAAAPRSDIIETLRCARQAILDRGWCQRTFACQDGVDVLGAVSCVLDGDAAKRRASFAAAGQQLEQALRRKTRGKYQSLTYWNDRPRRKVAEVIALYDLAIATAVRAAGH